LHSIARQKLKKKLSSFLLKEVFERQYVDNRVEAWDAAVKNILSLMDGQIIVAN